MLSGRFQDPAMKPANRSHLLFWAASVLCSAQSITVHVYDYAGIPADQWQKTAEDAGKVLAKAGYTVNWVECRGAGAAPDSAAICDRELGDTDYVLRLAAGEGNRKPGVKRALAHSVVQQNGGRYATLFVDAVQEHAQYLGVSQRLVLAYATAHELIHLLRGPAHSRSGVMKEYWTRGDASAIAQLNLPVR